MSAEDQQTLERTLIREAARAQQVDDEYQNQAQALNQEYEQTVVDFNTHTVKNMRVSAEEKERQDDLSRTDEMLGSL